MTKPEDIAEDRYLFDLSEEQATDPDTVQKTLDRLKVRDGEAHDTVLALFCRAHGIEPEKSSGHVPHAR